jgi:hypothetical protein
MKDIFAEGGWQILGEDRTITTLSKNEKYSVDIQKNPESLRLKYVEEKGLLTSLVSVLITQKDAKSNRYKLWDGRLVRPDELKRQLYKLVQNPDEFIEGLPKKN